MSNKETLVLIPARGGSKSIPYKNIELFAGHPLLAFSIAAGLVANQVDRVVVSTDDEEIARVARNYGAEVPFMRPSELAQDDTTDLPVFQHALKWLKDEEGYQPDVVVQLRPTSPLRPPTLVDKAIDILLANPDADSVRGVVPAGQNPHKMWRLTDNGAMQPLLEAKGVAEPYNAPRQHLPPVYWQTGHIDAIRRQTIEGGSMSGDQVWPLLIDPSYTGDIDTLSDLRRAEARLRQEALDIVWPGKQPRPLPEEVKLLVLDFDGVLTDDRVWVDEKGGEQVAAHRGDGLGIGLLKDAGIQVFVLSKERNPVVAARCEKLDIAYKQGEDDKASALKAILADSKIASQNTVYLGNDINDLPCFPMVACAAAVADAQPEVLQQADLRLRRKGGYGAVRELCDLILAK